MHASYSSLLSLGLLALAGLTRAEALAGGLIDPISGGGRHAHHDVAARSALMALMARQTFTCKTSADHRCPLGDGCCPLGQDCCGTEYCCKTGWACCDNSADGNCAPIGGDCCSDGTSCDAGYKCVIVSGLMKCCELPPLYPRRRPCEGRSANAA